MTSSVGPRGGLMPALLVVIAVLALAAGGADPAGAAPAIEAQGVALSPSATCAFGDVDITYDARDVDRQKVTFSAVGGAVLQDRTTKAFKATFSGTEHILAETQPPQPNGTALAVHVVVSLAEAPATDGAEFTVLYRCDATRNTAGGKNTVLWTCFGDVGACPVSADEALATAQTPGAVAGAAAAPVVPGPASVAVAVTATPSFTG